MNAINDIDSLKELVKVINSSIDFYQKAKEEVDDISVKSTIDKMLSPKLSAVHKLQDSIFREEGEKEDGVSFLVGMREKYAQALAKIKDDPNYIFIEQLEESEDKILDKLEKATEENRGSDVEATLRYIYSDMKACHDEMKDMQNKAA